MPKRSPASSLRWLSYCAICLSALELHAQEPKQVIIVESWIATIDYPKLRSLDLTWEKVDANGQLITIKIVDVLTGEVDSAEVVQRPGELLKMLERAGAAYVLTKKNIATVSGEKAVIEIGSQENGIKIETTSIANSQGQIHLDYRAEIYEQLPRPRGIKAFFNSEPPPGKKQIQFAFSAETESGLVILSSALVRAMPNSPEPIPIAFVRASIEKPTSFGPAVTTANANDREIP